MNSKPIHLYFEDSTENGVPVRRVILEHVNSPLGPRCEVWWKFPGQESLPPVEVLDSFASGFILWASRLKQDLVVHGPVTRSGYYNMMELLETRGEIWPFGFNPIKVTPEKIMEDDELSGSSGRCVAAISGGLDSMFTVLRHAKRVLGPRSYPLDGLMIALGFDIPLDRTDHFATLRQRMEGFAASLSLPLLAVESNAMHYGGGTWPLCAMQMFSVVLSQCTGSRGTGVVSSGPAYGAAYGSFGHVPYLDKYCSHGAFELVTDGGGFNRVDKVMLIKKFPEYLPLLRTCWEGKDSSRNCGVCTKCIITRLDFLAAGLKNPPCFDTPLNMSHITNLRLESVTQARDYFRFSLEALDRMQVDDPIAQCLRRRLSCVPPDHLAPVIARWARKTPSASVAS